MSLINPASRFHRTVKKLKCCDSKGLQVSNQYCSLIQDDEIPLGVYRVDGPSTEIVFTNLGLVFNDAVSDQAQRIDYRDIAEVEFPLPASDSVILYLHLLDGAKASLQVFGRQGNYRDVFEVGRFLMRVVEDRREIGITK